MEIEAIIKCTKGNPSPYQLFPDMPSVTAWPQRFENNLLWYPLLIVQGPSASGASKFAKGLFKQLLVLPSKMVAFKRGFHVDFLLGDVRDLDFLVQH